jgi:hypothetical protein
MLRPISGSVDGVVVADQPRHVAPDSRYSHSVREAMSGSIRARVTPIDLSRRRQSGGSGLGWTGPRSHSRRRGSPSQAARRTSRGTWRPAYRSGEGDRDDVVEGGDDGQKLGDEVDRAGHPQAGEHDGDLRPAGHPRVFAQPPHGGDAVGTRPSRVGRPAGVGRPASRAGPRRPPAGRRPHRGRSASHASVDSVPKGACTARSTASA